jgi:hypothetical protein
MGLILALLLAQNYNLNQGVAPSYNKADPGVGVFGIPKVVEETPLTSFTFQYGINTEFVTPTSADGGSVTQSGNMAVVATGTADSGVATLVSNSATRYVPGQGIKLRFTAVWTTCTANSRQEVGIGNANDGFFFGCVGASFGIIHRNNGSETFYPQTSWNGKRPTFNVTKGNVYSIAYQWLGFGVIRFQMELPSGEFVLVHQIDYPNTAAVTSVQNPIMRFWIHAANSGNTSNVQVKVPSAGVVTEGRLSTEGVPWGALNRKTLSGTYVNVLTLKNKSTFIDAGNQNRARLINAHISSSGNSSIDCRGIMNTTLGGSPSFADTSTATSFTSVDTAGTTVTGGRIMHVAVVEGNSGGVDMRFNGADYVDPGETFTIACLTSAGAASPTVGVALNWHEEF